MLLEGDDHKDNASDAAQNITANQSGDSGSSLPPVIGTPNPAPAPSGENHPSKSASKWRENTKMALEIFGVVLLTAYTVFSCLQWLQIRYTNNLTARALDGSDDTLRKTLEKMQGQIDQTGRLAGAAEKSNSNALATDRPWIGGLIQVTGFAAGQTPITICTFTDGGRRPAYMVTSFCETHIDKFDTNTIKMLPVKPGASVLLPGGSSRLANRVFRGGSPDFIQNGDQMTQLLFSKFNSGEIHIRAEGHATYRDMRTGEIHHTNTCVYYLPKMYGLDADFYNCNTGNDAN